LEPCRLRNTQGFNKTNADCFHANLKKATQLYPSYMSQRKNSCREFISVSEPDGSADDISVKSSSPEPDWFKDFKPPQNINIASEDELTLDSEDSGEVKPDIAKSSGKPAEVAMRDSSAKEEDISVVEAAVLPAQASDAIKGEVPLMLPEKPNRSRILVEVEDRQGADGLSSADLSGDTGAVGRLIVGERFNNSCYDVHVDLKGALYGATMAPAPGTMCVVSVGASEAKVEAMVSAFMQLKEESTLAMAEAVMEGDLTFADEDDDYLHTGAAGAKPKHEGNAQSRQDAPPSAKVKAKAKTKGKPKALKPAAKSKAPRPKQARGGAGKSAGGVSKRAAAPGKRK